MSAVVLSCTEDTVLVSPFDLLLLQYLCFSSTMEPEPLVCVCECVRVSVCVMEISHLWLRTSLFIPWTSTSCECLH